MQIEPEWGTMTLPEPEPSPLAATPGTEAEFQYPSNSENPSNQHDSEIPRSNSITTTTTITAEDEDLYRDLENLENVSDLILQNSEGGDDDNPFYSGKKLLPLITGNDDDTEIDGPDQLPVLDDPLSATLHVGSTENLEETVPLARRDRSRSEAGERDAELAGLAFAKHLALQIVSDNSSTNYITTTHQNYHGSGLVREDSSENGLTLVPATPPPTPLSRTSSSSSNISILNPTLSLHTVSEEGHGTEEELGNGEDGEEGGEEGGEESTNGGVRSLVSGGSLVINPPTTPMAASTRSNIPFHQLQQQQQQQQQQHQPQITILPPSSSAYIVPMTPPTTPQNRTSGPTTTSSTITFQKQSAGFYKPVKPELKQRSGKGASLLSSSSNQGGSGMPPPTPPVTPMNRTGFALSGRPPPIVANHIGDPAPTPPPTPMSGATNTPIASSLSIRVSTETAPDYIIPEMSPAVGASRSRSASDITGNSSGGLSEIKGHLSNSLLASKFATLSIQTPTSGTGGDDVITPRSGNAVIVACRVFDCTGRAFLRGYCAKHWRLAKRTPQEMLDSQDADTEQDGDEGEDSKSDLKVDSEPSTPASYEYTLPWLVSSEDGESHWQDWKEILIPASSSGGNGTVVYGSQEFNVTNVTIQEYLPQTKTNFECSPVSQLITILVGTFSIRASGGKSKTLTPGNMVLLQDNTGKGHQITVIGSGKHLLSRSLLKVTNPTSTATTQ